MATNEQQQPRAVWDGLADGFDGYLTPLGFSFAEEDVLPLFDLQRGERFLDIGCGSGALAIPAARLGADVVAVDISPKMIERLETHAREEGLDNLEGKVMDAYALELDDDTFDAAGSVAGVSILPELGRALGEMVRVIKPGGRALVVNFGPPQKAEFVGAFMGAMQAAVPDFAPPGGGPSPAFQLADPDRMRDELAGAGLRDVRVEQVTWLMEIESGEHLVNVLRFANPMTASMIGALNDEQRNGVEGALDGMLRERADGGTAVLNTECNVGIATK